MWLLRFLLFCKAAVSRTAFSGQPACTLRPGPLCSLVAAFTTDKQPRPTTDQGLLHVGLGSSFYEQTHFLVLLKKRTQLLLMH